MPEGVLRSCYVVGVGMTRFGKFPELSVKDLTREAVEGALADAGMRRESVERAFFANVTQALMEGQHAISGQIALGSMGFERIPIINVENACASGGTAFHLAHSYVASGQGDVALAVGAERMYSADKAKTFAIFDGGWDVHQADQIAARLIALGNHVEVPAEFRGDGKGTSVFMTMYASFAKLHMRMFGTTRKQMAAVAAKNHDQSVHNERSQYRIGMTVDEVLRGRSVAWPLTLPMCAPISDGGAAAIVCSEAALRRLEGNRPIEIRASVLASGSNRNAEDWGAHVCRRAALQAYEIAGIGPDEVDVAEVHDASAFAEILQSEALGLCELGGGGPLAESGATRIGGRIPINPSGGLESKGHPIGATGLGQIYELVTQLRGEAGTRQVEGAAVGIAENGGGFNGVEEAAACITILSR